MKKILLAVACLALGLSASAQKMHVFSSDNLHRNDTVLVYSPSAIITVNGKPASKSVRGGEPKNLPTLWLLHGYTGDYFDWTKHVDIQAVADKFGFRIICPDGLYDSWYIDNADPQRPQFRKFFWEELWPAMDAEYGLQSDRTFITGLSMGGHGAINLFLDHPELFKGAGSMSGVLNLKYSGGAKTYLPGLFGADDILDPKVTKECAVNRLEKYKADFGAETDNKLLVATCGTEDTPFVLAANEFSEKCRELGIRHIKMFSPGKHAWPYWDWALPYHLDLFTQAMNNETMGAGSKTVRMAAKEPVVEHQYSFVENIPYASDLKIKKKFRAYREERCKLDVWYPTDVKDAPVIVWFHGGGLVGGNKYIPEKLKNSGCVVIAANYRFMSKVHIKDCIDDAAACVAWTLKHCPEFNGDPAKVFVSGHSAGGYLTSMIGLDKHYLAKYGVDADSIAGYAPFSGQAITHYEYRKIFGIGPLTPTIDEFAPLTYVRGDAQPFLIISGDREIEMNGRYEEQAYFWRMLKLNGAKDVRLVECIGYDHGAMPEAGFRIFVDFINDLAK